MESESRRLAELQNFFLVMHKLAEHCKYGDVRAKLSEKQQFNPKLDLGTTIIQVRREEATSCSAVS